MKSFEANGCYTHRGLISDRLNTFPNDVLHSSKLKAVANDNFKFDENGRKFAKRVENTGGKGEIACYEQFLLFPQCFQKTCPTNT